MSTPAARGGLLDLFVPDARDRRAIDETLSDWREERARASGVSRLLADARGMVSCLRVIGACSVGAMADLVFWRCLCWSAVSAAAMALLLNIELLVGSPSSVDGSLALWLALSPAATSVLLAFTAAAGFGQRRSDSLPLIAAIAGFLAVLVILQGWIVPEANHRFRAIVAWHAMEQPHPALSAAAIPRDVIRVPAETTLPMLLEALWSADDYASSDAATTLSRKGAVISLCLSVVGLGMVVRRRLPQRWPWWQIQWTAGLLSVSAAFSVVWIVAPAVGPGLGWLPGPLELALPSFHLHWFATAAVVVLATIWLGRAPAGTQG